MQYSGNLVDWEDSCFERCWIIFRKAVKEAIGEINICFHSACYDLFHHPTHSKWLKSKIDGKGDRWLRVTQPNGMAWHIGVKSG